MALPLLFMFSTYILFYSRNLIDLSVHAPVFYAVIFHPMSVTRA